MTRTSNSEVVDVECHIVHDSPDKAAIAVIDGTEEMRDGRKQEKWFWLPRSQIEIDRSDPKKTFVTMPRWLAMAKGLI